MNHFSSAITAIYFAASLILFSCTKMPQEPILAEGPPPAVIPLPQAVEWGNEMYLLPQENTICYNAGGDVLRRSSGNAALA